MSVLEMLDRPIAFQRSFVSLGAGVTGALLLSQAVYWSKRSGRADGWFYKTRDEWEEETGLTRREQEGARKKLRDLGILEEKKQGIPCKTYYRISVETLQTRLHETAQLAGTKPPSRMAQNSPPITETTTETTTEKTTPVGESDAQTDKKPNNPKPVPYEAIVDLYHEILPELPQVVRLTAKRKAYLKARWQGSELAQDLGWWRDFFLRVRGSDFLMGRKKDWRANFEFLITESKFIGVLEGQYDNRS